jgi:hypothetical protein
MAAFASDGRDPPPITGASIRASSLLRRLDKLRCTSVAIPAGAGEADPPEADA